MRRAAALLLVVALGAAACTGDDDDVGPGPSTSEVPTTQAPDYSAVVHAPVPGETTTTLALGPGSSKLQGLVLGPDGPVVGARVEVTRMVGGAATTATMTTGEDGRYDTGGILGGRYRVRAWQSPDLALVDPVILFLDTPQVRDLDLKVTKHSGLVVTTAVAPNPFELNERVEVVARLGGRFVDDRGVVRTQRQPGVAIRLVGSGSWTLESPNPTSTNSEGDARWVLRCKNRGRNPLSVVVGDQDTLALSVPDCGIPPTTTEAPPPSSQA